MELKRITRSLPCKLTAAGFVARGQELAETVQGSIMRNLTRRELEINSKPN